MTFNATVPNATQSPSLFPAQANTNWTRLQTIINAEHVFNDTGQVTDGVHRQCTFIDRADPVSLISGTNSIAYSWADAGGQSQLKFFNGTSTFQITPGIVAAVNFDGTGGNGMQTLRGNPLNITSVERTDEGLYTVTFTTALPDTNYIAQICGMRNSDGSVCSGFVQGDTTYGDSVKVGSLLIGFSGGTNTPRDVLMGNVTIMRY